MAYPKQHKEGIPSASLGPQNHQLYLH